MKASVNYYTVPAVPGLTVQVKIKNVSTPIVKLADLRYNALIAAMTGFDDSLKNQLDHAYPVFQGGVSLLNGKTYPGLRHSDGTDQKMINYRAMLVMITNDVRENNQNTPNSYIWPQVRTAIADAWHISNHTPYHGGGAFPWDSLRNYMLGQQQVFDATGYKMIVNTTPGSDNGYMYTGKELGSLAHNSTYQEGNDSVMFYDKGNTQKLIQFMSLFPSSWFNFGRENFGDNFDSGQVSLQSSYIDNAFNSTLNGDKFICNWLTHGPGDPDNFATAYEYIYNHPTNIDHNKAWVTSVCEILSYFHVKMYSSHTVSVSGDIMTINFDHSRVNADIIDRGMSLLLSGVDIDSIVSYSGWDQVTFNPSTGLMNLYKIDNSNIINPSDQQLPAQITSLIASGNNVLITYDKQIGQSMATAYTVSGNTVIGVTGSGSNWTVNCTSQVNVGDTMSYRMYNGTDSLKGNAITADNGMRVCDYINYPIS